MSRDGIYGVYNNSRRRAYVERPVLGLNKLQTVRAGNNKELELLKDRNKSFIRSAEKYGWTVDDNYNVTNKGNSGLLEPATGNVTIGSTGGDPYGPQGRSKFGMRSRTAQEGADAQARIIAGLQKAQEAKKFIESGTAGYEDRYNSFMSGLDSSSKSISDYSGEFGFDELEYEPAESSAVGLVEQEFEGADQREARELSRYGINPSSGRGRDNRTRRAMNLALARSGARLEARKGVDTQNYERGVTSAKFGLEARGQDINERISNRKIQADMLNI